MIYDPIINPRAANLLDHEKLGASVRESYRYAAEQYRKDDEIEITTNFHAHISAIINSLSGSFGRPITVLEVGCGTGRYFHCLKNVRKLVGIDVSDEMLEIARKPVLHEKMSVAEIELRCENAHLAKFPAESFDLIYSLGMFGHGCPVTVEICDHFHEWLAPGGHLFFNVVGVTTMPLPGRIRMRIRKAIYPVLPLSLKKAVDARSGIPFFGMSQRELSRIIRRSHFEKFNISKYICDTQLWRGVHLECHATKSAMVRPPGSKA